MLLLVQPSQVAKHPLRNSPLENSWNCQKETEPIFEWQWRKTGEEPRQLTRCHGSASKRWESLLLRAGLLIFIRGAVPRIIKRPRDKKFQRCFAISFRRGILIPFCRGSQPWKIPWSAFAIQCFISERFYSRRGPTRLIWKLTVPAGRYRWSFEMRKPVKPFPYASILFESSPPASFVPSAGRTIFVEIVSRPRGRRSNCFFWGGGSWTVTGIFDNFFCFFREGEQKCNIWC